VSAGYLGPVKKSAVATRKPGPLAKLPKAGIIGAGRLGCALAASLSSLGYHVSVSDVNPRRARSAYRLTRRPYRRLSSADVAAASDVLFLTVPDHTIKPVFDVVKRSLRRGALVVHCSGAMGARVFGPLRGLEIETLALHPVQSFATDHQAARSLCGSWFAIDGTPAGLRFGRALVRRLKGRCTTVRSEQRPLYHAMCVFGSNFVSALLDAGQSMADRLGIPRRDSLSILLSLARSVIDNAEEAGVEASLTGPIERGDAETVEKHLEVLDRLAPELVGFYRATSLHLVAMARRKGLAPVAARRLRAMLNRNLQTTDEHR